MKAVRGFLSVSPRLLLFAILIACAAHAQQAPAIDALTDGVRFSPDGVAPGGILTVWGRDLAPETASAQSVPLPTTLAGVTVTIGDIEAPLFFVSAGQIDAQVPFDVTGTAVTVVVHTATGTSNAMEIPLLDAAPTFFFIGETQQPLIFDPDFQLVESLEPGHVYIAYLGGLGQTNPPMTAATGGAFQEPLNRIAAPFRLELGGEPMFVEYVGAAPGFVGVYQVNFRVPNSLAHRDTTLAATVTLQLPGDEPAQELRGTVPFALAQTSNVEEAESSVEVAYPTADAVIGFTPNLSLCGASVRVKPAANAKPFRIWVTQSGQAAGKVPSSLDILVDPVAKTYRMRRDVPTNQARNWRFDYLRDSPEWGALFAANGALDFYSASPGQRPLPFPGGAVPPSRIDPIAYSLLAAIPLPNESTDWLYDTVVGQGSYAGDTLEIGTPEAPLVFGQFSYPYVSGPAETHCALYIDGVLQKSATRTWTLAGQ